MNFMGLAFDLPIECYRKNGLESIAREMLSVLVFLGGAAPRGELRRKEGSLVHLFSRP